MRKLSLSVVLLAFSGLGALAQPFLTRYENMYVMLRTGIPATLPGAVLLEGLDTRFDGKGGIYLWSSIAQDATNDTRIVVQIPGVDPGRWFRCSAIELANGITNGSGGTTIITNLFVGILNVTNITAQYLYFTFGSGSNLVAGNWQGPVDYLVKFGPDNFSGQASLFKQVATNEIDMMGYGSAILGLPYVAGTGSPMITWGLSNAVYGSIYGLNFTNNQSASPTLYIWGTNSFPAQVGLGSNGDEAQLAGNFGVALGWGTGLVDFRTVGVTPSVPIPFGSASKPWASSFWNATMTISNASLVIGTNGSNGTYTDDGTQLLRGGQAIGAFNSATLPILPFSLCTYTNIYLANQLTGTNIIWTVPLGFKAITQNIICGTTNTASVQVQPLWVDISSVVRNPGASPTTIATNTASSSTLGVFILEPGESFAFSTTGNGVNVQASFILFPSSLGIRTVRMTSFINGNNTFYTAPAGKRAFNWPAVQTMAIVYHQSSGAPINVKGYLVPKSGSPSLGNVQYQKPVASASIYLMTSSPLYDGESFVLNVDSTDSTQTLWMNVFEQ